MKPAISASTQNQKIWSLNLDHEEYPEDGGIIRWYTGIKFHEKGFAFPEGIYAANFAKRLLMNSVRFIVKNKSVALLLLVSKKMRNDFVRMFNEAADLPMIPVYFNGEFPRYYRPVSKEIRKFLIVLMRGVGIEIESSELFAKINMTVVENDSAYVCRIQDLAGVTTKEKIIENFPREAKKIIEAAKQREGYWETDKNHPSEGQVGKLKAILRILTFMWYIPKFRKVLRNAIQEVQWGNVILDEHDRGILLLKKDYNIEGRPFDERAAEFYRYHPDGIPSFEYRVG